MTKVTAKFVFELPFPIVIQGEYGSSPQSLKTNSEEIVVYAPALYAPTLSDKPLWRPGPKHHIGKVNDEPIWEANCILIDIRRDLATIPIADEDQKALVAKAREILYKILTLCRWRGKQLHINVADIEKFDYRLAYFDNANNPIGEPTGMGYITFLGPPLKSNEWNDICQDLVSETMPELYESLLLDAHSVVSQEPRRAVLDASTACEVFIENFCETASKSSPKVDPIIYSALKQSKKREGEVLFYFHEMLKYLFGHSLKDDKPDLYEKLYCLCKTNNSVKHEGKCQYKEKGKKGKIKKVHAPEAREFIKAVEEAIEYTKSLAPS